MSNPRPTERDRYKTDLTDAQWEIIRPLIPPPKPGGRPRAVDMREVLNTLLYQARTGCQWELLPHDLLPKSTVYDYFQQWRDDGTWGRIVDALRQKVRVAEGREPTPRVGYIDSQTVKTTGSAASGASTATRRSPGGSGTSPSSRWGCSWRWSSPRPRPTMGRRRRGCSGSFTGLGSRGWRPSGATGNIAITRSTHGWSARGGRSR
jgi:transposase